MLAGLITYIGYRLFMWNRDYKDLVEMAELNLQTVGGVILAIGLVVMLIAFLGWYGACCENDCALKSVSDL